MTGSCGRKPRDPVVVSFLHLIACMKPLLLFYLSRMPILLWTFPGKKHWLFSIVLHPHFWLLLTLRLCI
jgi:hypothetical protein